MHCGVTGPERERGKEAKKGVRAGWSWWRKASAVMCVYKKIESGKVQIASKSGDRVWGQ